MPVSWIKKSKSKEIGLQQRKWLLGTLNDGIEYDPNSLFNILSKLISSSTIYEQYLSLLPIHVRASMLQSASLAGSMTEAVLFALLEKEEEELEWSETENEEQRLILEGVVEEGWENSIFNQLPISISYPNNLTSLDLSFSQITLTGLQRILLSTTNSSSTRPPKSNFPYLKSLKLSSTAQIPLNTSLFDILKTINSLQSLSLTNKVINPQTSNKILSKLALATPYLIELDLSFNAWVLDYLEYTGWSTKWFELKKLGLRTRKEGVVTIEQQQKLEEERLMLWGIVSGKNGKDKKSRSWIEIIL